CTQVTQQKSQKLNENYSANYFVLQI
ncbi:uncharacterized protein METZ01_LOCUS150812, partial [marine metagenome]